VREIESLSAGVKTYISTRPVQSGGFDQLAASDDSGKGPRGAVDVDDEMLALVKFTGGATGSIEATATPTAATISSPSKYTATRDQ
jgi:hypothetical protein